MIEYDDFLKVEMHVGTIIMAEFFAEARNPSYKLWIEFGDELGIRKSSAQITDLYSINDLINTKVVAVTNFPPKQIATFMSEVLVLGATKENGQITLLRPDEGAENGNRIS